MPQRDGPLEALRVYTIGSKLFPSANISTAATVIPLNEISPSPKRDGLIDRPKLLVELHFSNGDSTFRANLDTGLATQALICIYRLGLTILHLENLRRTSIDTFFITGTFIFINNNFPHDTTSEKNELRTKKRCYCNLDYKAKQYAKVVFL